MIEVGQVLATKNYPVDRALLLAYANASGDHNPIHQNEEFALSVGLPNVIAHGMLTMALAGKYLSDIAGPAAVKEFSARFTKPVVVPADTTVLLEISGTVLSIEDSVAKIDLTVICDGQKVLGNAKAQIVLA
ncbi:MAG: MaoC/PaaZ C-terminal domain-containing protein [Actinomycetes bacterium]